jgi:hypothetical protein
VTDNDDVQSDGGQEQHVSRADNIHRLPRKWPVGPEDDYPSFGAQTNEINADPLLASTTQAQTVSAPRKSRHRLVTGAAAVVVALVAAAIVIWQWPSGSEKPAGGIPAAAADTDPISGAPGGSGTTGSSGSRPGDSSRGSPDADAGAGAAGMPSGQATPSSGTPSPGESQPAGATTKPTKATASATAGTPPKLSGMANPSGANLALNGVASASSIEPNSGWTAGMAIDGDTVNSRWSSGYSDPQWWKVDLKAAYRLTTVTLFWERAHATSYSVQTSTDGSSWKTIYSTTSGLEGTTSVTAGGTVARYVRVYGTKRFNQYGYSLYEVQVR